MAQKQLSRAMPAGLCQLEPSQTGTPPSSQCPASHDSNVASPVTLYPLPGAVGAGGVPGIPAVAQRVQKGVGVGGSVPQQPHDCRLLLQAPISAPACGTSIAS